MGDRAVSIRGFSLVEIMVAITLAMIVMGAALGVSISQLRHFDAQLQSADASESVRGVAALLSDELRAISAARGDIIGLGPFAVTLRTVRGSGTVCAKDPTLPKYAVDLADGDFDAGADDSVLAFIPSAGSWKALKATAVWADPGAGGLPTCAAPSTATPNLVLEVAGDTAGIETASDVMMFRATEYGLFQQGGRWWLGRRVGAAAGFDRLTGPLLAPADSGLVFHYYDAAGNETADGTQVDHVEVVIRSQSYRKVRGGMGVAERRDSTSLTVSIRN